MLTLRPYQDQIITDTREAFARGCKSPLVVSPTGSGKTAIFSAITHGAYVKRKRVMILAHRAELIDQISEALHRADTAHGFIAAGYPSAPRADVIVASVQTLVRRLSLVAAPDLIICDEAHHVTKTNTYGKIFAAYPNARLLGVTATACRLGGEALGDVFDALILGPTVQTLTDAGYLTPARIFAPPTVDTSQLHTRAGEFIHAEVAAIMDKPTVMGDAISHYRQHADGKPAVCFCYSVEHSLSMAAAFRSAGYIAAHLDGKTDRQTRRDMIRDFREGRLTILCSVDVVAEGFDVPGIHCGILLRPTASESLYLQQVGRVLRPAEGKQHAIILDHCGNTLRHGLPSEDREWSLSGRTKSHRKQRDADDISIKVCPKCFTAQASGPRTCSTCGHEFEIQQREVTHTDGQLQELTPEALEKRRLRREQGRAQTLADLEAIEKARGYKRGWAEKVWDAKQKKLGITKPRAANTEASA